MAQILPQVGSFNIGQSGGNFNRTQTGFSSDGGGFGGQFNEGDILQRYSGPAAENVFFAYKNGQLNRLNTTDINAVKGLGEVKAIQGNVLGDFNSLAQAQGRQAYNQNWISLDEARTLLGTNGSTDTPYNPNSAIYQRSQGTLPEQQFSNGQFTGTPPPLPTQSEIDARDKMNNQMYGTPLQGTPAVPSFNNYQTPTNQPTGADFAKYFGQGGAGYLGNGQSTTPPTSPNSTQQTQNPVNPANPTTPQNPMMPQAPSGVSALEQSIQGLLRPSLDETNAQKDIDALISSRDFGLEAIRNKQTPMQFIAGESDALARQAALKLQPLQQRLAILQAQRQASLEASKFALDRADKQAEQARQDTRQIKLDLEKQQNELIDRQDKAQKFALDNNITSPFYTVDGQTIIRTVDQKAYSSPEQFFADGGAKDFSNVQKVSNVKKPSFKDYPVSYQEYQLAKEGGYKGSYNDYQNLDANRKAVRNTTIINQKNEGTQLGTALAPLNASKGSDGYVNPSVYLEQRSSLVGKGVKASDFDNSYAAYLNPTDRARLGIGKASGVDAVPESDSVDPAVKAFLGL